jgi:hypothetical protein
VVLGKDRGLKSKKPAIPERTGGFHPSLDLLPSAGIIQQVRGVVPPLAESLSRSSSPSKSDFIVRPGQQKSRTKKKLIAHGS